MPQVCEADHAMSVGCRAQTGFENEARIGKTSTKRETQAWLTSVAWEYLRP
jgi:hypothetical protein